MIEKVDVVDSGSGAAGAVEKGHAGCVVGSAVIVAAAVHLGEICCFDTYEEKGKEEQCFLVP